MNILEVLYQIIAWVLAIAIPIYFGVSEHIRQLTMGFFIGGVKQYSYYDSLEIYFEILKGLIVSVFIFTVMYILKPYFFG